MASNPCPSGTAQGGTTYNNSQTYCSTSHCGEPLLGNKCTYHKKAPQYVACYSMSNGNKVGDYYAGDGFVPDCCGC